MDNMASLPPNLGTLGMTSLPDPDKSAIISTQQQPPPRRCLCFMIAA
jgi:hypothetical protein